MKHGDIEHWEESEFVHIASEQARREDEAARWANKVLICDTDAFATSVWFERYMHRRSPAVEAVSQGRSYDLTLLTDVDIPFVQDGYRDGEHIRHWMHARFIERLGEAGRPYLTLSGSHENRLQMAITQVEQVLSSPTTPRRGGTTFQR
jgi:nicotinamide riboside kinase